MKLLLAELDKQFEVNIWEPKERNGDMSTNAILYAIEFNNYLAGKEYDGIIIRGDRYEMLALSVIAVYKGFKIIHIEGGDLSGVIDNRVRGSITKLADYHFCTSKESHTRLVNMGVDLDTIWNFGALDTEFANEVKPKRLRDKKYILCAFHPIEGEDETELDKALKEYEWYDIIRTGSNKDYGRKYGAEEFSPEDYINLMRYATICIGNSSSLIKEASILKVPVVLVGDRQRNRLLPKNVLNVPCKTEKIIGAIEYQSKNRYEKDLTYYQKDTSKQIAKQLLKIL